VARLKADAAVQAIVTDRVYDFVPEDRPDNVEEGWPFPYATVGTIQIIPEHASGRYEGAEAHFTVDTWSRAAGFPEVKRLGDTVVAALHYADLDLDGHRLVDLEWQATHYLRDKDGLTSHGVHMFKVLTDLG